MPLFCLEVQAQRSGLLWVGLSVMVGSEIPLESSGPRGEAGPRAP